jgi:hypothetical protein
MTEAWTKWVGLVSEQSQSSQTVAAFCGERGLRAWHFYDWKKRVRESEAMKLVEVQIAAPAEPLPATCHGISGIFRTKLQDRRTNPPLQLADGEMALS